MVLRRRLLSYSNNSKALVKFIVLSSGLNSFSSSFQQISEGQVFSGLRSHTLVSVPVVSHAWEQCTQHYHRFDLTLFCLFVF